MFPYIIFAISILIARYHKQPKAMVIILIMFAVLRYNVGWDYWQYYNAGCQNPIGSQIAKHVGWLWEYLFVVSYKLRMPHFTMVVAALITYISLYYGLKMIFKGNKQSVVDALTVYSFWPFLYLTSFSTIRQSMAIGLMFLIIGLITRRNYLIAGMLLILNYYIHSSSIIIVFIAPFLIIKYRQNWIGWLILCVIVIGALYSLKNLATILAGTDLQKYAYYIKVSDNYGSSLQYLLLAMVGLMGTCIIHASVNHHHVPIQFNNLAFLALFGITSEIAMIALGVPTPIWRILDYFIALTIITVYYYISMFKDAWFARMIFTTGLVALFFVYLIIVSRAHSQHSPYIPYNTILLEESYYPRKI